MATASPEIEQWDDNDFDGLDDVHFRTASTATSVVSHPQVNPRDSVSSRLSIRSESNHGDENWDVLVDEQASVKDAVALARSKGIPLPTNVPRSALEGGTIRRLQGKQIKKAIADDWSEDLDFSEAPAQLQLARPDERDLSESLRNISAAFHGSPQSPEQVKDGFDTVRTAKSKPAPTPLSLDDFKDDVDDVADFGDVPTIRVAKHRTPRKDIPFSSLPRKNPGMENIEEDFELPANGQLRLSTQRATPKTPQHADDFDAEWAEGSLGTRNAGGRRVLPSNRSSSVSALSALSPSASSSAFTAGSDDGLDGLILPSGLIRWDERLNKRKQEPLSPVASKRQMETKPARRASTADDWSADIIIPDEDVFDTQKQNQNRNIQRRNPRAQSPGKRPTTTLSFSTSTNKLQGTVSRLPRFQSHERHHERVRSSLEPVLESSTPGAAYQRPSSRVGHLAHVAISAIPGPSIPAPSTPNRRGMGLRNAESRPDMRYEPTTTNAQLLRAKRSMPVIRNLNSPTKQTGLHRPSSRQGNTHSVDLIRPKTPTERSESRLGERRSGVPFLPAGASTSQSQHVSLKPASSLRHSRRHDSDGSGESMSAAQRSLSRLAGMRPETPGHRSNALTASQLAAQAKKIVTKPSRRRNFGDGSELELFDDLPTSAMAESRFVKQPVGRGPPRNLRGKLGTSQLNNSSTNLSVRQGSETPTPITPMTPSRHDFGDSMQLKPNVPRFAQDTAASRNAREQRAISTTFHNIRGEPLQPISNAVRSQQPSARPTGLVRRKKRDVQRKPHLIKPMGDDVNRPKEEKGMNYNPTLFRWEGNENALVPFDVPEFNPPGRSPVLHQGKPVSAMANGSPNGKSNRALITNVGISNGVQVVGGMVFDPRQMKWLKVAEGSSHAIREGSGSVQLQEEEDVFAGLEDLKEESEGTVGGGRLSDRHGPLGHDVPSDQGHMHVDGADVGNLSGHSGDEQAIAEEFDVGPEFTRRQHAEEERWRRKVEKWLRSGPEAAADDFEGPGGWRWAIRDLVCDEQPQHGPRNI